MSDGRHVIVKQTPEGRVRLRGVFDDESFARLPLVRSFGAFPSGYWACHYGAGHTSIADQILALPEAPVAAEAELGVLERVARRAKYRVESHLGREYVTSVAAANARAEEIVRAWRGTVGPRGGYSHTASKYLGYGDGPNEPGKTIVGWWLRYGHRTVALKVTRVDARGALEYAGQQACREVA